MTDTVKIASSFLAGALTGFAEAPTEGPPPHRFPQAPPQDLEQLAGLVEEVRMAKTRLGELGYLKYGLQWVLHQPLDQIDYWANGHEVTWEPEHLRRALVYLYERLFPDEPLPATPPNVEIVKTDGRGWDALMREQADRFPIPEHVWKFWREHGML